MYSCVLALPVHARDDNVIVHLHCINRDRLRHRRQLHHDQHADSKRHLSPYTIHHSSDDRDNSVLPSDVLSSDSDDDIAFVTKSHGKTSTNRRAASTRDVSESHKRGPTTSRVASTASNSTDTDDSTEIYSSSLRSASEFGRRGIFDADVSDDDNEIDPSDKSTRTAANTATFDAENATIRTQQSRQSDDSTDDDERPRQSPVDKSGADSSENIFGVGSDTAEDMLMSRDDEFDDDFGDSFLDALG